MSVTVQRTEPRSDEARRALVLHDRPLVVDLIELTLNHGVFAVRPAGTSPRRRRSSTTGSPTWSWSTWITTTARRSSGDLATRTG